MDEGNNLDPEDQLTNKCGTPSDQESKDIIIDATLLSLRRKNPNVDINQFLSDARAVISSLSQEERDSDGLHIIIVNKLGGETQYSDEDEVFYLAVKELLDNSEIDGMAREYLHKSIYTMECTEDARIFFESMARRTVEELKNEIFRQSINGMMNDFVSDTTKSPSESDTDSNVTGSEGRKRKASVEDDGEHTSNAKRLPELPTNYEVGGPISEQIVEYMFTEGTALHAEVVEMVTKLVPVFLTLLRKFINDDYTQFEERIRLIISVLTPEDLESDDLLAVFIRKSNDGIVYTAEDEEYFKAFQAFIVGNDDIMADIMKELKKEALNEVNRTDAVSELNIDEAKFAKYKLMAGMTIEEIRNLKEKVDD